MIFVVRWEDPPQQSLRATRATLGVLKGMRSWPHTCRACAPPLSHIPGPMICFSPEILFHTFCITCNFDFGVILVVLGEPYMVLEIKAGLATARQVPYLPSCLSSPKLGMVNVCLVLSPARAEELSEL